MDITPKFEVGDRVRLVYNDRDTFAAPDGTLATVVEAHNGLLGGRPLVKVKWDDHVGKINHSRQQDGGYFEESFVLANEAEAPAPDSNSFMEEWAGKLEEFANSATRVSPYSYIGFIATLLMDYDALEEV